MRHASEIGFIGFGIDLESTRETRLVLGRQCQLDLVGYSQSNVAL